MTGQLAQEVSHRRPPRSSRSASRARPRHIVNESPKVFSFLAASLVLSLSVLPFRLPARSCLPLARSLLERRRAGLAHSYLAAERWPAAALEPWRLPWLAVEVAACRPLAGLSEDHWEALLSEVSVSAVLLQEPSRRPRLPSWHPISASCPAGTTRLMSVFEIRVTG